MRAAGQDIAADPAVEGTSGMDIELHNEIRARAYELWERHGHSGNAIEHWVTAERDVLARRCAELEDAIEEEAPIARAKPAKRPATRSKKARTPESRLNAAAAGKALG